MSDGSEKDSAQELLAAVCERLEAIAPGDVLLGRMKSVIGDKTWYVEKYIEYFILGRTAIHEAVKKLIENRVVEIRDEGQGPRMALCRSVRNVNGSDFLSVELDGYAILTFNPNSYSSEGQELSGVMESGKKTVFKIIEE